MNKLLCGDAIEQLATLPAGLCRCCVTSPPYYGLRDYGVDGQIGLETTLEAYIAKLVEVFRAVWRVLADDGTLWLNIADTYQTNSAGFASWSVQPGINQKYRPPGVPHPSAEGCKPKDLMGVPWRLAFALQADGWYLRQDIIWDKPNCMPESVTDRCTKSHEYLFLLAKGERYYYDHKAIREPIAASSVRRYAQDIQNQRGSARVPGKTNGPMKAVGGKGNSRTFRGGAYTGGNTFDNSADVRRESHGNAPNETNLRNKRSVWRVATAGLKEAHFATFPPELVRPCILAGSAPGDVVLDPFGGSGTTGVVASQEGRGVVLIDLNPAYVEMAGRRIQLEGHRQLSLLGG